MHAQGYSNAFVGTVEAIRRSMGSLRSHGRGAERVKLVSLMIVVATMRTTIRPETGEDSGNPG